MASPTTLLSLCVTLLQVSAVYGVTGQEGQTIASKSNFRAFRNLISLRCNGRDVVGAGGRSGDLLNTPAKRDAFAATLTTDQQAFFTQIINTGDHSFDPFTEDEARSVFLFLYNLDTTGKAYFLQARANFDQIPYEDVLNAVQFWHPIVFLLYKKEAHCYLTGELNETLLETYCMRFADDVVSTATFLATVNRCGDCVALGVEKRQDASLIGMLSDYKCRAYMDKVRQYKMRQWDVYYLSWCPQAVMPGDIGRIADSNFCDAAQQLRLKDSSFTSKLKPGVLRKIGEKLISCFGQLNTWTDQRLMDFAAYVVHLPRTVLRDMTVTQFATNFDSLVGVPNIQKTRFMRVLGYRVASWWAANIGTFDNNRQLRIACAIIKYAPDRKLYKLLTRTNLQDIVSAFESNVCNNFQLTPEEVREVVTQLVTDAGFNWDTTTLGIVGKYIGRLPARLLKEIPQNVICPNWQSIRNADIEGSQLAILWDKCSSSFSNPSAYTCNDLQNMGSMVRALPKAYIVQVQNAVLAGCIGQLSSILESVCERKKGLCKRIMKKVKTYAEANSQTIGDYLGRVADSLAGAVQDYTGVTIANLGGINNLNNLNFENRATMQALWKKVKATLGAVTHDNTNYCGESFTKIHKIFFAAASPREWTNLCEDENVIQNIARAASMLDKLDGRKIRAIINKLLRLFGASGTVTGVCIDGPLIEQVAPFLPHAKGKDLAKFSKDTLKHIIKVIGDNLDTVRSVTRSQMKFLTRIAFKTQDITTTISVATIDETGPYTWCGITADDVSKLPDAAITKYGFKLLECEHLDISTNRALVQKLAALTNSFGPSVIADYGDKFMYALENFPVSTMTAEMKEIVASQAERLMEKLSDAVKNLLRKDNRDITATEKDQINALRKQMSSSFFDILLEVKASGGTRRKRSASNADCTLLSSLPGNLDFLTDTQISSFQTTEVKGCLTQFAINVWDTAQCTAWRAHLVHTDGLGSTVSAWTKPDVQALGTLVDCLTSAEVQSLNVDDDVIQALGAVELTKAADVIAAYISTTGADLTTISDETMSDMGNMTCGFSSTQIGDMPQASVHATAKDLNTLGCMDATQLSAVGNKIVAVEGSDWSGKESTLVGEFGNFIGGLQQSVLTTFTADQVTEITPNALKLIPPATFAAAFDATKLAGLSPEQSNAVTTEQLNQLSPEQRQTVEENSSYNVQSSLLNVLDGSGDGNNGATSRHLGAFMTGILLVYIL